MFVVFNPYNYCADNCILDYGGILWCHAASSTLQLLLQPCASLCITLSFQPSDGILTVGWTS